MSSKKIDIAIAIISNGETKKAFLSGYSFNDAGFLVGELKNDNLLSSSEKILLTAFTFTGCPIAARTSEINLNPWRVTDGEYLGKRTLTSKQFQAKSILKSTSRENGIEMNLELSYSGKLPNFQSAIKPFQESIKERELGIFEGNFEIPFLTKENEVIPSFAKTIYELDVKTHFAPVWRNITIINSMNEESFKQIEQIDLFGDIQKANDDIFEKLSVFPKELSND